MFTVGATVTKKTGYEFTGIVVAAYNKLDGKARYVVESTVSGASGLQHIFSGSDIKFIEKKIG